MVKLASRDTCERPQMYLIGRGARLVADIGEWGVDEATVERELEEAYAKQLVADGARVRRQVSTEAGVAFFHKQNGGRTPKANGRELDGRTWDQFPQVGGAS